MSREILFRAWDKEKGEYWTDVLTEMAENDMYDDNLSMWDVGKMMNEGDSSRFVFEQYTGLKDKNGKKIFEGDILRAHTKRAFEYDFVVFWCEKEARLKLSSKINPEWGPPFKLFDFVSDYENGFVEIIGNIHEQEGD